VEYELTALGRDLLSPVNALADWALANAERVERAQAAFDRAHEAEKVAAHERTPPVAELRRAG
jgi:hypothetical protein